MFHVERGWMRALRAGARELSISLDDGQVAQFSRYLTELVAWNEKMNLTAITDTTEIAIKHFLDSLLYSQALVPGPLLDIGSGAGFPGLPLKILSPDLPVTLLEPNKKKTAFLHHLIGTLGLATITVISRRLEDLLEDHTPRRFANLITRALDVRPWLPDLGRLILPGGRLILGRTEPFLQPSLTALELVDELTYGLPGGAGRRVLSILRPKS